MRASIYRVPAALGFLLCPLISSGQGAAPALQAEVWHGHGIPEPEAHELVVSRLRENGYEHIEDAGRDYAADVGVLWAWRP